MKKLLVISGSLLVFAASCKEPETKTETTQVDTASVKQTTAEASTPPMDSAAIAKAWIDFATPGDMHKMMAKSDGSWATETKMWMESGKEPTVSTGTATNKMILGGRYQQSSYKGTIEGMPFEGTATSGYDNAKKLFVSTWVDNMGTGIMTMEGTYDETSKTMNMKGKQTDCTTGKDMEVREVQKWLDDNTMVMEMYMTQGGQEMKTMEITHKRK
jgi:Protein of unknown function (DUF1579).